MNNAFTNVTDKKYGDSDESNIIGHNLTPPPPPVTPQTKEKKKKQTYI